MPELNLQLTVFLTCVGLFTAVAAVWDLRTRRIPNKLTLPALVAGIVYQLAFNGLAGLGDAGLAFLVGFGSLFVLWIVGGGGGGDVKLMGALSVWLGFAMTWQVLITSTVLVVIGTGFVLLLSLVSRGMRRTKRRFLATGKQAGRGSAKGSKVRESVEQRQERRVMAFAIPVALATWGLVIWHLPSL